MAIEIDEHDAFDEAVAQYAKNNLRPGRNDEEIAILTDNPVSWLSSLAILERKVRLNIARFESQFEELEREKSRLSDYDYEEQKKQIRNKGINTERFLTGVLDHKKRAADICSQHRFKVEIGMALQALLEVKELLWSEDNGNSAASEAIDVIDAILEECDGQPPYISGEALVRINDASQMHLWKKSKART